MATMTYKKAGEMWTFLRYYDTSWPFYDNTNEDMRLRWRYQAIRRPLASDTLSSHYEERKDYGPRSGKYQKHSDVFFMPHTTSIKRPYNKRNSYHYCPQGRTSQWKKCTYWSSRRLVSGTFYGAMARQKRKSTEKIKSLSET